MTGDDRATTMNDMNSGKGGTDDGLEADITPHDDDAGEETAIDAVPAGDAGARGPAAGGADELPPPSAEPLPEEAAARASEQLKVLKAERDKLYDAWLRTSADFDNHRKRTEREREEFRQYATESLLLQLLPVLDNFERALDSLPPGMQRGFAEGVRLIYKQLGDLLAKHGVTPIEAEGELFDPNVHEAVETEARTDVPHHSILNERQRGYRLGKRVIRPARVKVSVRPDGGEEQETAEGNVEGTN